MDATQDNNDDTEGNSETNLNSLTENNSLNNDDTGVFQQEITDVENIRNEAVYKIREREPATRAPSFVVLPREPSGSMRTALKYCHFRIANAIHLLVYREQHFGAYENSIVAMQSRNNFSSQVHVLFICCFSESNDRNFLNSVVA
jgi:hypothetical protein